MEGARAHFHVVGLQDHALLIGPEILESQDQALEAGIRVGFARHVWGGLLAQGGVRAARMPRIVRRNLDAGARQSKESQGSPTHRALA